MANRQPLFSGEPLHAARPADLAQGRIARRSDFIVQRLAPHIVGPGDLLSPRLNSGDSWLLVGGDYGEQMHLLHPDGRVKAALGAEVKGLRVSSRTSVSGLKVNGDLVVAGAVVTLGDCVLGGPVTVEADATLILHGGTVRAEVSIASGGKVHAIGVLFEDGGFIDNAGLAANAHIIGCSRKSGISHVNVTVTAETT